MGSWSLGFSTSQQGSSHHGYQDTENDGDAKRDQLEQPQDAAPGGGLLSLISPITRSITTPQVG